MQIETLAQEFARLVAEYRADTNGPTGAEAWNLIADFSVENAAALSAALSIEQTQQGVEVKASELASRLRETTEAMAHTASVDMGLWERHSNACLEAASEIESLTSTEERLRRHIKDLQDDRLLTQEALKPFAACADEIDYSDKERDQPTSDDEWAKFRLLVGDYRRARAVLDNPTSPIQMDAPRSALVDVPAVEPEPVAWYVKDYADGWIHFDNEVDAIRERDATGAMMHVAFPAYAHPPVSALVNAQADADVVGDSELNRRAFALARQAYDRKWADISSPAPTEEPDAGDGPLGYAIRAYLSAAPTDWYDVEDRREQKLATVVAPDNGTPHEVLSAVLECARAWVPEARIIGNVRAGDIARAVTAALSSLRPAEGGSATGTSGAYPAGRAALEKETWDG